MEIKIPKLKSQSKEEIFSLLFKTRDSIHLRHLSSKSYSEHKALQGFYDDIIDMIDSLIESYQGKYGLINISIQESSSEDPIVSIGNMCRVLESQSVIVDSWLVNQVDEIITLGYQTIYKLKNLK